MNRSDFLKSLAVVLAAPKVLTELPKPKPKFKYRYIYYVKIPREMHEDYNTIYKVFEKLGIDFNKPLEYNFSYEADDLINNLITCVIKQ